MIGDLVGQDWFTKADVVGGVIGGFVVVVGLVILFWMERKGKV